MVKVSTTEQTQTAFINGKAYGLVPGETVLSFVRRHLGKTFVPTLCDAPARSRVPTWVPASRWGSASSAW